MDTKQRVDVFINVHKGLRRGLLSLALHIGQVDWTDGGEVITLGAEFATMLRFLRDHAANEDEIQFPLLEERSPGSTRREKVDHQLLEAELDQLEAEWGKVVETPDREGPGYEFYLAFNRFLSGYLAHMDREERDITWDFYKLFSDEEIKTGFQKIIARTPPQDMVMMLGYMIPAMNSSERFTFLSNLRQASTPEVFGKVRALAQEVLPTKDWENLSAKLE